VKGLHAASGAGLVALAAVRLARSQIIDHVDNETDGGLRGVTGRREALNANQSRGRQPGAVAAGSAGQIVHRSLTPRLYYPASSRLQLANRVAEPTPGTG
jgi:hypothetical protein